MKHFFAQIMVAALIAFALCGPLTSDQSQARDAVQADLDAAQGTRPQLNRGKQTRNRNAASAKSKSVRPAKSKPSGSSTPPALNAGADNRQSQRNVCQSQCNLQRMSCDQGRNGLSDGFRNRSDQINAAQSSCYLAVQGCLSRC